MRYWAKSWNTTYGCTKIRRGCTSCWAASMAKRMQANGLLDGVVDADGNWTGKIVYKPERLDMPRHWKQPQVVAVNWMSDMFYEMIPHEVWPAVYKIMAETPRHCYLVLTKRYDIAEKRLWCSEPLPNVYAGFTISDRKDMIKALPWLFEISRRGWKTWVSFEPALEEVSWVGYEWLNGMVCGGESGTNARPMPIQAAYGARDYCRLYKIPFTFKQGSLGAPAVLDGRAWTGFPLTQRASDAAESPPEMRNNECKLK